MFLYINYNILKKKKRNNIAIFAPQKTIKQKFFIFYLN